MARSKHMLNFTLLAIVLVLSLSVWLDLEQEAKQKDKSLFGLTAADVRSIRLQAADKPAVVLQRKGDDWFMSAPFKGPAHSLRVTSLLKYLRVPASASFSADEVNLADAGLADTTYSIRYNDVEVRFGGTQPVTDHRYIQVGQQVHLVPDAVYHHLITSAGSFYAPEPLMNRPEIVSIRYPGTFLEHRGGQWYPTETSVSWTREEVSQLARNWRAASARQVKAIDESDPEPSKQTVRIVFSDLGSLTLGISIRDNAIVFSDVVAGVSYYFAPEVLQVLLPHLPDA